MMSDNLKAFFRGVRNGLRRCVPEAPQIWAGVACGHLAQELHPGSGVAAGLAVAYLFKAYQSTAYVMEEE
jgi:hypothetical protein